MLQNTKTQASMGDIRPGIPEEEGLADIAYFGLGILRRQYLFILFVDSAWHCMRRHLPRDRDTNLYRAGASLHRLASKPYRSAAWDFQQRPNRN